MTDVLALDRAAARAAGRALRRRAEAKGRRLEALVRHALEREGALVEGARKSVVWRRDPKDPAAPPKPRSAHHDFFGCFDLVAVFGATDGRRCFVQVTTLPNVADKRAKILATGFPASRDDAILAQEQGRWFRELRGPGFEMPGRRIELPALPRRAAAPRPHYDV